MILCDNIILKTPLVLAPLAGYTDMPFRELCKEHGASLGFTELISAEAVVRNNRKTFKLMEISGEERPVGIQLFGKDPETLIHAAAIAEKLYNPEIIDLNCGCSVAKVSGHGSGAALLKDPLLIAKIISGIKSKVTCHVSAKIRLGWEDSNKNYRDVVAALCDSGVSFITVHGRTRAQKFSGYSDWDTIAKIASFSPVPIIGNGDIDSYETAMKRLKDSGCKAVMIGRAAIGNPWIFSGETPSLLLRAKTARSHFAAMTAYYGDYGIILARKHLSRYFHGFDRAAALRGELVQAETAAKVLRIIDGFIGEIS
jgi:tRNA-dihydrouridine synthase B